MKHPYTELNIKNFEGDVKDKASIYVPAIGKVTIVVLLRNLLVSRDSNALVAPKLKLSSDSSTIER